MEILNEKLEASATARENDTKIAEEWRAKITNDYKNFRGTLQLHKLSPRETSTEATCGP